MWSFVDTGRGSAQIVHQKSGILLAIANIDEYTHRVMLVTNKAYNDITVWMIVDR